MVKKNMNIMEIPLNEWRDGWLTMEIASKLNDPLYLTMLTHERKKLNYPCTRQEQIDFLKVKGGYKT